MLSRLFSSHRFSCSAADALDDTRLFARQSPIYRRVFRRVISGSARCAGCRRGRITTGEIGRNKRSSSLARSANCVPSCPRVPSFPFSQRVYSTFQRAQSGNRAQSAAKCTDIKSLLQKLRDKIPSTSRAAGKRTRSNNKIVINRRTTSPESHFTGACQVDSSGNAVSLRTNVSRVHVERSYLSAPVNPV